LCADTLLVRRLGVTGSAWMAGLLDGGAGLAAFWLSRRGAPPAPPRTAGRSAPRAAGVASRQTVALLLAAFLAGGSWRSR
jgi:hypothetical protein